MPWNRKEARLLQVIAIIADETRRNLKARSISLNNVKYKLIRIPVSGTPKPISA